MILLASEVGMLARVEPFWTWHTPIAWTGYILLVDGILYKKRGNSWLMNHRLEFYFLALVSIPLWLVFEAYNLLISNWHYINLPENLLVRYFGYAWAFATISPGIFLTAELVAVVRGSQRSTMADLRSTIADRRSPIPDRPPPHCDRRDDAGVANRMAICLSCGAGVSRLHLPARSHQCPRR
ncbi:MAG TPA: hypothetical protein VJM31_10110 [Vicinamibacterales bacterium]|nr:hypothetical protein [Vicinamibacterales bacterium]